MNDKNKPIIIGTILLIACVIILVVVMSIKGNSNTDTNSFKSSSDVKKMVKRGNNLFYILNRFSWSFLVYLL